MVTADGYITEFDQLDKDKHDDLLQCLISKKLTFQAYPLSRLAGYHGTLNEEDCSPFAVYEGNWCASRWVGIFHIGRKRYTILPRIGKERFELIALEVLSATAVPGSKRKLGGRSTGLDLLPLVWGVSFENARQRHGLPRVYVRREESDCTELRGELDLEQQLKLNQLTSKQHLACRWDDLTLDNPINQGSRIVIDHLRHHRRYPFLSTTTIGPQEQNRLSRELDHWRERLPLMGVTKPAHFPLERGIRWSRANDSYRLPHRLASWLVENRGQGSGHTSAPSILIDSAEVWELYLQTRLCKVVIKHNPNWSLKWPRLGTMDYLLQWQGHKVRGLIPDFQIADRTNGNVIAILDAKYRRYQSPADDRELATQMALYTATARSSADVSDNKSKAMPIGILLYPRTPSFNSSTGVQDDCARPLGAGAFQFPGKPKLFAWSVALPEPAQGTRIFHETIDEQLSEILKSSLG